VPAVNRGDIFALCAGAPDTPVAERISTVTPSALPRHSFTQRPVAGRLLVAVSLTQAAYDALTGIWSLVSIGSFQRITGPKVDLWLVKTVGALVLAIGGALGLAGLRRHVTLETAVLGAGSAAALGIIDVVYVAKRRIAPIYLADALAEAALVLTWVVGWVAHRRSASS
jgi:hypothetical protein